MANDIIINNVVSFRGVHRIGTVCIVVILFYISLSYELYRIPISTVKDLFGSLPV